MYQEVLASFSCFVFQDDTSESDIKVKCGNDQQFVYPTTWPTCVDRLNCPKPFIDETVMSYDWDDSIGVTPEYSVEYTCVRLNKLLGPLADLDSEDEARIDNLGWVHLKLLDCLTRVTNANCKKLPTAQQHEDEKK